MFRHLKHLKWRTIMANEYNGFIQNDTQSLVTFNSSQNTIGCKWVFRLKRKSDGIIDRYKACLVAKGFHQCLGLDYHDTLSPVVKPTIVR